MVAANPAGEEEEGPLQLQFDRSVKLAFRGSSISSDGGLLLRQSVFSRLAGYENVNDADLLRLDPVMRQLVGGRAMTRGAASASAMGRFETTMLTQPKNLAALEDLPGRWIDAVHDRQPPKVVTLDMDSSESPMHGDQEGAAWNGYFQSKCLHPLFVFNQFDDLERCALRPGNVHSADGWEDVLRPVLTRYSVGTRPSITRRRFRADASNAIRLQLHALAYNLASILIKLVTPAALETWSLTSLRERLVKTGARLVKHARYAVFQFAEAALPRAVFAGILGLINGLRDPPIAMVSVRSATPPEPRYAALA
ncbi:transposase [Stappia sp. ES.058]|uniref:transposase n=1 Tax=Stappia sp. ES.058 TaxID=1881061 RepID=UPI00087D2458|nr:transposase [Stappia sp. ES.058]SDT99316.1 Transposase DDE domain group 1 [Stappia sp. ES.058]